ncbi:MAG: hypothetical protein CMG21_03445 [Candidatus Marinimicrobia bacterium]|nr:hypothetical protein [Candidatus Neomarinimicrobiota bacterium]|tara:strand:- start:961 stop:2502 length:1542 start_codon:yes stop_codon:yes gene_type:complete
MIVFLLLISIIFPNETAKISEAIITETHYGYHNLKAASTRQTIEMVYAPDTTPHSYPSWPYIHVYGNDTLFYESNYYVSDKDVSYRDDYYRPYNIKVRKDTVLQFVKQTDQLKTKYRKSDGKKDTEELMVTSYEHYNRYNQELSTGVIVNNISSKNSFKRKQYFYDYRRPNYEFVLYDKDDQRFELYYPFFEVKDSTLRAIKYTFSNDRNRSLYKEVSYVYALNKIDGQNRSFITKINHFDFNENNYFSNDIESYNSNFKNYFKIPSIIPSTRHCEESCPTDSLSFFIDSLGRIVKRKTFYIPDDCSYGGYATTDSIFNSKGQLIIEKPGYHSNGTKMGPPYTIKEFRYHDNGQVSDIISDGNIAHLTYDENGNILMKKYLSPENNKEIYQYDDYGNLIFFNHNFDIDTDYSQSYKNKYEHIYNDRGLLIESYIYYYQPNPGRKSFSSNLINDNNLNKYLIARYNYNEYDKIIKKEEYTENGSNSIPFGNKYALIHKLTTYEYKYHKCFECEK